MEQKTFEEILREKMGQEVSVRGKDGVTMLPMEAMVMSLMNEAMKGSIPAIMFIRSLTEGKGEEVDAEAVKSEVEKVVSELRNELRQAGLPDSATAEMWLLAKQLLTLRRIALTTAQPSHTDVVSVPQKNGPDKMELSTDNRIFNDLLKQWRTDWHDYKTNIIQEHIRAKIMKKK